VARLRQDTIDAEGADLRRQAARWAADALPALQQADPDVPEALQDRAADCWRPLLAIAAAAGGEWPARARAAAVALSGADLEDADIGTQLLADIRPVLDDDNTQEEVNRERMIKTEVLLARLHEMVDRPWPAFGKHEKPLTSHKLARLLKPFGILSAGQVTFPSGSRARAYRIEAFTDAFARYLPSEVSKCDPPNETGPEPPNSKCAAPEPPFTSEMQVSPMNTGSDQACSLREPGNGRGGDRDVIANSRAAVELSDWDEVPDEDEA
jgi:hypothetical protein